MKPNSFQTSQTESKDPIELHPLQLAIWRQEIADEVEEAKMLHPSAQLPAHEIRTLEMLREARYC